MTDQKIILALEKEGLEELAELKVPASLKREWIWKSIAHFVGCKWTTIRNARRKGLGKSNSKLLKIYAKEKGIIKNGRTNDRD